MVRTSEVGFIRRIWCRFENIAEAFIKEVLLLGSLALINNDYYVCFMSSGPPAVLCDICFSFPFPTASTGHFCGRTDERSYLCNIYVPAVLWEAVFLFLLSRTGVHCGVLGWEGRYQVRWLILVISFFPFSF